MSGWYIAAIILGAAATICTFKGASVQTKLIRQLSAQIESYQEETKKQQEETRKQQKDSEKTILEEMRDFRREFKELKRDNAKRLSSQFPAGYQLFAINKINNDITPDEKPPSAEIKISWSTAKIISITKDFIEIMLPDTIFPGNNRLIACRVRVKNEEGATASGDFVVGGWASYVQILKSEQKVIIAAVGYVKIKK